VRWRAGRRRQRERLPDAHLRHTVWGAAFVQQQDGPSAKHRSERRPADWSARADQAALCNSAGRWVV